MVFSINDKTTPKIEFNSSYFETYFVNNSLEKLHFVGLQSKYNFIIHSQLQSPIHNSFGNTPLISKFTAFCSFFTIWTESTISFCKPAHKKYYLQINSLPFLLFTIYLIYQ